MKKLIVLALIALSQIAVMKAEAKEEVLATITNDEDANTSVLIASTDDSTSRIKNFFKDNYQGKNKINRESLSTNGLNGNGVILDQRKDRIVISLKSTNFDMDLGGTVTIDTLLNGVTNERKEYIVELAKGKVGWKIWKDKKEISRIHIEVNKKSLIGSVGVKNIRME